ncbi:MAG: agmatine deiminase family protein [Pseudomonadota bacterium]
MTTQAPGDDELTRDGFYMPAEWAPHERCWMMWPARLAMWDDLGKTQQAYANVANAIADFEPVSMLVSPAHESTAKKLLSEAVTLVVCDIDDSWARDAGPNFLINAAGELAGSSWRFNAWGNKYTPFDADAKVGEFILESAGARVFRSELTGEGGGITVDGQGTIITTESCFLHTNRNPGWSRAEVEAELKRTLGGSKVIWLPGNPDEKETDGHVDGIAQFVKPGVVVMETSFDTRHPYYDNLQRNREVLEASTDASGQALDVILIEDGYGTEEIGCRYCLSYVNSYIANGAVILPSYGIDADERARQVYARVYPEREIVQLDISGIAVGGGGIHCITQQQPAL